MDQRTCKWCRAPFVPQALRADGRRNGGAKRQRYCSTKCNEADYWTRTKPPGKARSAVCAWCSAEYTAVKATQRFCSRKCNEKGSYRERVGFPEPWSCNWCGKLFNPMTHKRGTQLRFCSKFCRSKAVVLTTYNVTGKRLFEILAKQDELCATGCGTKLSLMVPRGHPEAVQIDHDHECCPGGTGSCGKCVRGLLCPPCNQSLGWLEAGPIDSWRRWRAVGSYLDHQRWLRKFDISSAEWQELSNRVAVQVAAEAAVFDQLRQSHPEGGPHVPPEGWD